MISFYIRAGCLWCGICFSRCLDGAWNACNSEWTNGAETNANRCRLFRFWGCETTPRRRSLKVSKTEQLRLKASWTQKSERNGILIISSLVLWKWKSILCFMLHIMYFKIQFHSNSYIFHFNFNLKKKINIASVIVVRLLPLYLCVTVLLLWFHVIMICKLDIWMNEWM